MPVVSSTFSQSPAVSSSTILARKWLAQKLIALAEVQLVLRPLCDEVKLDLGMGKTANFAKVGRGDLPDTTISEGVDPSESAFPVVTNVQITADQWGAFYTLTDVVELTVSHPILQIAVERLSDIAARLIDTEIGRVMLGGTQVQFSAGRASRGAITAADVLTENEIHKLRITEAMAGAPARSGSLYDFVIPPPCVGDLQHATANYATWAGSKARDNPTAFETAAIGSVLGMNIIQSNYLPFVKLLGAGAQSNYDVTGVAVANAFGITDGAGITASQAAGTLNTSGGVKYFPVKITRRDRIRGYDTEVSLTHSVLVGNNQSLTLVFPSTTPTVFGTQTTQTYDVYLGAAQASAAAAQAITDANLFLTVSRAVGDGTTVQTISAVGAGVNPPASPPADGTIVRIGFVVARSALNLVTLQNLQATLTPKDEAESNPLGLRRKVGFKFMMKSGRRDETRLLRWEGASAFATS